ncbi:MAG: hypothetical protein ACHQNE_00955 [Candidatus Kapaibacterium sp.]
MEQALILLALLAVAVFLIFYFGRARKKVDKSELRPGVRREAAVARHVPKANTHLFKREVISGGRRFFFDVEQGDRGKYLRISELEKSTAGGEKAYTLIVFEREIIGFQKALTDSVREMGGKA